MQSQNVTSMFLCVSGFLVREVPLSFQASAAVATIFFLSTLTKSFSVTKSLVMAMQSGSILWHQMVCASAGALHSNGWLTQLVQLKVAHSCAPELVNVVLWHFLLALHCWMCP